METVSVSSGTAATESTTATKFNPSSSSSAASAPPSSSCSSTTVTTTTVNNNSNSNNPIFVITNLSTTASSGEGISNNLKMPSNSTTTSSPSSSCGGEPVVSSSAGGNSNNAHSEDDDAGGGAAKSSQGVNNEGSETVSSTSQQQRHPRLSCNRQLTRSLAIENEDDCVSGPQGVDNAAISTGGNPIAQEKELLSFIIDTCNRNVKDKHFILRIEADLTQFVKDESRLTLPFPQMTSYQRMLVHRMSTLFDLDHNVDNSSGGNFVVVSKDLEGGHKGRIPPIRFKELPPANPAMIVSTSSSHLITSIDPNNATSEMVLIDPISGNTLATAPVNTASASSSSKKILKREKPMSGNEKKGGGGPSKTKSLEERTQDYHKARRRIFNSIELDNSTGDSISGISPDNSASTSTRNWSSTDSSEDRMYLKPPYPGKLIKVESFESASQKKQSNSRGMGKSHSFGGYEDSNQPPHGSPHIGVRGGGGGKNFPIGANASSSSMISSSSSSLRSSSFESGQSPSGGASSSTSGYKSSCSTGGSSAAGLVAGYYTGIPGGIAPTGAQIGSMPLQVTPDALKASAPAIVYAPVVGGPPQQIIQQTDDMSSMSAAHNASQASQQVLVHCCFLADLKNVPQGAVIIDPQTGQAIKNTDGSQYYYDPMNPPKLEAKPQQQQQQETFSPPSAMYPPTIAAYAPVPAQTPTGGAVPATPPQPAFFTNAPAGSHQDIQHLFSQLTVATGPSGERQAAQPSSVIYVPVDAFNSTASFSTPMQTDPQSQGGVVYYEDGSQMQPHHIQPQQQQQQQPPQQSQPPMQFQAPPPGAIIQQVVDPNGAPASGVFYYNGNLVQAQTSSIVQHPHAVPPPPQPRSRVLSVPHPATIHQHPSAQSFQLPSGVGHSTQHQSNIPMGAPVFCFESAIPPNSIGPNPGGPSLVSVLPPPHPSALTGAPQLSTLSYHQHQQVPHSGTSVGPAPSPQTLIVQSPMFPIPHQSFVPSPHNHPQQQQQQNLPSSNHHHHHNTSRPHHYPSPQQTPPHSSGGNISSQQHHHHPKNNHPQLNQNRYLAMSGASATAAAAIAASQQQLQQQFFAAAAMAMSNNYPTFTSNAGGGGMPRYGKGNGRGGGGNLHPHGAVTGVNVRRGYRNPPNKQQNSSKQ